MKGGEIETANGVRLVARRHHELERQKGVVEEVHKDKVRILLVEGVQRVKEDKPKMVVAEVEPVEVISPDFGRWDFLEQLGVGNAPTRKRSKSRLTTIWCTSHGHIGNGIPSPFTIWLTPPLTDLAILGMENNVGSRRHISNLEFGPPLTSISFYVIIV